MKELLKVIAGARPTHLLKSYTVGDTHLVVVKPDVLPPAPNLVTIYDPTGIFVTIKYNGKRCNELVDCEYCEGIREYTFEATNSKAVRTIAEYDFTAIKEHIEDLREQIETDLVHEVTIDDTPLPKEDGKVQLPHAGVDKLGIVKQGRNITIDSDGSINAADPTAMDYNLASNKPKINGFTLQGDVSYANLGVATETKLGTIKVGANLHVTEDGTLSADAPYYGAHADWAVVTPEADGYIKNKPFQTVSDDHGLWVDTRGDLRVKDDIIAQSDWLLDDYDKANYIKNRPFKTIGSGLAVNAEGGLDVTFKPNVKSDWAEQDPMADSYIYNKPDVYTKDELYTKDEIDTGFAKKNDPISTFTQDDMHRTVTETQIENWEAKQPALTFDDLPTETSSNPVKSMGIKTYVDDIANTKVDKVEGKGLSTNDFTDEEKDKVDSSERGAQKNVQSDWAVTDDTADEFIRNKPSRLSQFENDKGYVGQTELASAFSAHNEDTTSHQNIRSAISSEATTRQTEDGKLLTRISALESRSDVVDVVACYDRGSDLSKSDLVHYDKSALTDKDVIKILKDETKDNQTTYYRYYISTQLFSYIGGIGPFVTIEALADYVPKTRKINNKALDVDVTLTASDIEAASKVHGETHLSGGSDPIPVATSTSNGLMSASDKTKLDGVEEGAQKNVASDWSVDDESTKGYIKSRPFKTIGTGLTVDAEGKLNADATSQVQSDWGEVDTTKPEFIKNKPFKTIGTGLSVDSDGKLNAEATSQVQSNWAESDTTKPEFIKNKPFTSIGTDGLTVTENSLKLRGKSIYTGTDAPTAELGVNGDVYIQYTL